jgi:predicted nucleic acid-binding protein
MATAFNLVDSSAWLEYLADSPNAGEFAGAIEATAQLIVPTLVLTEVARRLDAQGRRRVIPQVVAHMRLGNIVPLDETLALAAASVGRQHTLHLADSIVYATAAAFNAIVWTQNADFKKLAKVEYRPHPRRRRT